jgi:transposase
LRRASGASWTNIRIRLWFQQREAELRRKSALAEAIGYALNEWDGLVRLLDDGRIEIDSNAVERSMRPIALNRKNALFAGHDLAPRTGQWWPR